MNLSKYIILFLSALVPLNALTDTSIILTKANVQKTIEAFDKSTPEKNINNIDFFLADDVNITLEIYTEEGSNILKLNKNQYIYLTLDAWSKMNPSIPNRVISKISIDKKTNKATVECITTEIVEIEGKIITNRSKELLTLIANNGRVRLVEIYSQVSPNE